MGASSSLSSAEEFSAHRCLGATTPDATADSFLLGALRQTGGIIVNRGTDLVGVIIADDHAEMRDCIANILRREFYVMGATADGAELIHAALRLKPDVVVSDVFMPRLNGPEAKQILHASGENIPFVFVTSDCLTARRMWRNLGSCINKCSLFHQLRPAVWNAISAGGKSPTETAAACQI
jgi:CheY-like chemotaxis protein